MQFPARDTVLAANQHPQSWHPLSKRNWRVLKYGSHLDGELLAAGAALPALLSLEVVGLVGLIEVTSRAPWAIKPAHSGHSVNADLLIGEVLDCLLKCLGSCHTLTVAKLTGLVKYIYAVGGISAVNL